MEQQTYLENQSWQVLVVDDEAAVHQMLDMVLEKFVYKDAPLTLHHAYSAEEAKAKLEIINELAVILLDVVMETEHAGLNLVNHLRNQLKNTTTQVVIMTGQPGLISANTVISDYEINSYHLKSETLSNTLFIALTTALRSFQQLRIREDAAWQDQVTGLGNRRMFDVELERAIRKSTREGSLGALVLMDLDNFKTINDLYGHHTGDLLLQGVAARLLEATRGDEIAARVGGDELALIATGLKDKQQIGFLVERLLKSINKPLLLNDYQILQTMSVGVSFIEGDAVGKDTIYRQADEAMYSAKKSGKNTYRLFDSGD